VRIAIVNYVWRRGMTSPGQVLEEFPTLVGWAEAVASAGGDVRVYQRFPKEAQVDRGGVRYVFVDDGGAPAASVWRAGARDVHARVVADRPDVVHVNGVLHPRRVRALRQAVSPKVVIVVQDHGGFAPQTSSRATRAWLTRGLRDVDALMVAAPDQEHEWRASGIVPADVRVVNVMESSTTLEPVSRDEARRRSGVSGAPALLWVGRLTANKDPLTVLRGVEQFVQTHPGAHLTLVYGRADLEPQVRACVAGSELLSSRVTFVGRVSHADMPAYYCAADVLVSGSHHEGSGYAVIEALACGAVPVVTDIPPFRALTDSGRVGALWTPGDPSSLAAELSAILERIPADRIKVREIFEDKFSWPAIGRRALEVYGGCVLDRLHYSPDNSDW
jgi:glycosyltransferase involved in cell wall biosynthesis